VVKPCIIPGSLLVETDLVDIITTVHEIQEWVEVNALQKKPVVFQMEEEARLHAAEQIVDRISMGFRHFGRMHIYPHILNAFTLQEPADPVKVLWILHIHVYNKAICFGTRDVPEKSLNACFYRFPASRANDHIQHVIQ